MEKVKRGLSAGRVQSVAVRLIVEREKEISDFITKSSYKIVAQFLNSQDKIFKAELNQRFHNYEEALEFIKLCDTSNYFIKNIEKKPSKKSPVAPFTTSTLQQEASRKLGFSVSQTMSVAQKLYEAGKITYMRTDSVNLSDDALKAAENEILKRYGKDFSQIRTYKSKSKGAQEAHEAIRPTYISEKNIEGESSHQKLYDLIWKRTISSQMSDAMIDRTNVKIKLSSSDQLFIAKGEVITFEGFLKVYSEGKDDIIEENENILPLLEENEPLNYFRITATESFTRPPARYAEASLVRKMEELGIGRPSTYASTITTIQKRGYIEKENREGIERVTKIINLENNKIVESDKKSMFGAENKKLFPTDIGIIVTNFLIENFTNIMQYSFTASVENEFDEIAEGKKVWNDMIESFYKKFHSKVVSVVDTAEKASGQRQLGVDPDSGLNVYARIGPFGPMIQIGEKVEDDNLPKPKFASLIKGQTIQSITLEEALDLFKLPRKIGIWNDKEVIASVGRFGPYLRYDGKFTSIKKTDNEDPLSISLDRAVELIKIKQQADKDRVINEFEGEPKIQVLNGRYGPFVQVVDGKKRVNLKIPKDMIAKDLTRENCLDLLRNNKKSKI